MELRLTLPLKDKYERMSEALARLDDEVMKARTDRPLFSPTLRSRLLDPAEQQKSRELLEQFAEGCFVFRESGRRLPADRISDSCGRLRVAERGAFATSPSIRLLETSGGARVIADLESAVLIGSGLEYLLFLGQSWSSCFGTRCRQTWLCTPSRERGKDILAEMILSEAVPKLKQLDQPTPKELTECDEATPPRSATSS
jgi:hypothetical protein